MEKNTDERDKNNVATQPKGVYCAQCYCLLGINLSNNKIPSDINLLCYLCANNLVLVADTLGFISPNGWAGCFENLPSEQDLIKLDINRGNNISKIWHSIIQRWSKDIRDEHQAEKIRKL